MIPTEEIKPKIKELAEKYRLTLVVLFGSQATGKTHPQSDIDFAFLPSRAMNLSEIARMEFEFSQNLKLRNLELVNLKTATPFLLKQIAGKSILLYEREHFLFANFKIYAFKRFMEAKKLFDLRALSFDKFLQKI